MVKFHLPCCLSDLRWYGHTRAMQADEIAESFRKLDIRTANAIEPLQLGPIIVARQFQVNATLDSRRSELSDGEFLTMYFPSGAEGTVAHEIYIVDGVLPPSNCDTQDVITLLAPYRFLAGILPSGPTPKRLPRSIGLRVLQRYIDGLLMLDRGRLCNRQTRLAANAIRSLLAAALLLPEGQPGLASRRRASLLERIVAHIDANLLMPQSADSLCAELGCSRSALYRATAEAGGAEELIWERRLIAIRNLLRYPAERRAIAQIARVHCFSDTTQFNRRFKSLFGMTPGEVRRRGITPETIGRYSSDYFPHISPRRSNRRPPCS